MPSMVDRIGGYRGYPVESGVGTTRNGFPQFVARLAVSQRWVDSKEEMEALGMTEAGWADWSPYEQEITGYFCMFGNDKENPGAMKETFQFEALQKALGWDGSSFAALGSTDWSKRLVTFGVEENEYPPGTVSMKVAWIDDGEASATRSIQALDPAKLKDLDAKFAQQLAGKKKAAAPAKAPAKGPVAAPAKPTAPVAAPKVPAAAAPAPAKAAPAKPTAPSAKPTSPSKPAPTKATAAPAATGMTYMQAWESVNAKRGTHSDDEVASAFIDACAEVAPNKDETNMTPEEAAKCAEAAIAKLA